MGVNVEIKNSPGDLGGDHVPRSTEVADLVVALVDARSDADVGGEVLVISQFTLYGDTRKGRRPTWDAAAPRPVAEPLVDAVVEALREHGATVGTGVFGADMRVELTNDGPITLVIDVAT
jgi:D-tyrosyl-tRNA(Tyr) deacylase